MGILDGRVAVVTGSGRGIGREFALCMAREGANIVVNDVGVSLDGQGTDEDPAAQTCKDIEALGVRAVPSYESVTDFDGAGRMIQTAVDELGRIDILVNNAGIVRDRSLVKMTAEDFDAVVKVHMYGTFNSAHHAAVHMKEAGYGRIINVTSQAGLRGNFGQTNYGAAKAAIASLTLILAEEIGRYVVRVNGVVPVARTRMTADVPAFANLVAAPADPAEFDVYHPGNVSPLVAWLLRADCAANGQVFYAKGGEIRRFLGWHYGATTTKDGRWEVGELDAAMAPLVSE
jgi:NAD(P)-dependent dehydrogenase (short-subunit alcohol dehydrogenase family)